MPDEKQQLDDDEAERDLEVSDEDADAVRGGLSTYDIKENKKV